MAGDHAAVPIGREPTRHVILAGLILLAILAAYALALTFPVTPWLVLPEPATSRLAPAADGLWHDAGMRKPKYSVRIGNVYFLSRIGLSLRWAAAGVTPDQLAPEIRHLLSRLDQVEAQQAAAERTTQPDSDAAV
jgi:hypothetical protein